MGLDFKFHNFVTQVSQSDGILVAGIKYHNPLRCLHDESQKSQIDSYSV